MHKYILFLSSLLLTACAQTGKKGYSGHGADSVPPALLKKFSPKPLDSNKLDRIESLLDVRSPGMGQLTPDGQHLLFSWSITGNRQVWKISKRNHFPVQMTGGQDSTRLAGIAPNGQFTILTRDKKGDEYPSIYMQDIKGGSLKFIAGQKKVKTSPQFISKDSKYLYYTMNDSSPVIHTLYKVHLKTLKRKEIFKGIKGYLYVADHRANGEILLGNATGNIAREYYLFNEKTKKLTPLLGQKENEFYDIKFGKRSGEYFVKTDKFGNYQRLYSYKKGKFKAITPPIKYDVSDFSIDRNRKRILYAINKSGYEEVKAMSARNFKSINLPFKLKPGVLHTYAGSTTPNSRYTIFGVSRAKSPRSSYIYDWRTGRYSNWTLASSPEINTTGFIVPSLEEYKSRDGVAIPMFVNRPPQCKKNLCPVIVRFHGGPESQSRPYFSPYIQMFVEQGFIYVQPNVRGSSGYGKEWLHADNGPKRLKVITDIEDISRHIKKNWSKNGVAPKIGVMGGSYGGYSTNVAMTMFAGAYDAGVSVVGMSDLISFLENTGAYRRHLRTSEYGDPEKDREALIKLSPVNYLNKVKDPMLIIHGATDPRVPAGEAIQIYNALEKKGIDSELILFADEGHGVRKRKNRALYMGHIIEFFNKHLK